MRIDIVIPVVVFIQSGSMCGLTLKEIWDLSSMADQREDSWREAQAWKARVERVAPRPVVKAAIFEPLQRGRVAKQSDGTEDPAARRQARQWQSRWGRHWDAMTNYQEQLMVTRDHEQLKTYISCARALSLGFMGATCGFDAIGIAKGQRRGWAMLSNGLPQSFVGSPEFRALPEEAQAGLQREALSNLVKRMVRVFMVGSGLWLGGLGLLMYWGYEVSWRGQTEETPDEPERPEAAFAAAPADGSKASPPSRVEGSEVGRGRAPLGSNRGRQ